MRAPDPVSGVPEHTRYRNLDGRYGPSTGKGDAGSYESKPTTLEEEARGRGWLPGARPTGPDPIDLYTVGMRGEPGYDDDPSPSPDGVGYTHLAPRDGDISSID